MENKIIILLLLILTPVVIWLTFFNNNEEKTEINIEFNIPEEIVIEDISPNVPAELLADILIIYQNYQTNHQYFNQVNEEIFNTVKENIKLIDIEFLKAIWYSQGRIILTDGLLTDIETLHQLRGEQACYDALNTCRPFETINGLHFNNRAYKRIRACQPNDHYIFNDEDSVRNYCDIERRIYFNTATLFHEIGHLLDQSIALIEQFGDMRLRRLSDTETFRMTHEFEFEPLFRDLPGLNQYYQATWEYAAESFAMFYGFNQSFELRDRNLLRERAPATYNHFRNIIQNYEPRRVERR